MEKRFLQTLNIYRGKGALQISPSPAHGLIFVNLAHAIPGMKKKMPSKAEKKYEWEKKLTVSFNFDGALEVAATARALMEGRESLVADPQGNAKTLGFYRAKNQSQGSRAAYYLGIIENTKDGQGKKIGIPLEHADLYKIACVMEEAALALLGWRKQIEEANGHAEADKEPLQRNAPASQDTDSKHSPAATGKDEDIF